MLSAAEFSMEISLLATKKFLSVSLPYWRVLNSLYMNITNATSTIERKFAILFTLYRSFSIGNSTFYHVRPDGCLFTTILNRSAHVRLITFSGTSLPLADRHFVDLSRPKHPDVKVRLMMIMRFCLGLHEDRSLLYEYIEKDYRKGETTYISPFGNPMSQARILEA